MGEGFVLLKSSLFSLFCSLSPRELQYLSEYVRNFRNMKSHTDLVGQRRRRKVEGGVGTQMLNPNRLQRVKPAWMS